MTINFDDVYQLEKAKIKKKDKWVYAADFNIKHSGTELKSANRIDEEIEDIQQIIDAGGITAILAHQGRFKDGSAEDLDFIVPYLSSKLKNTNVYYFPENNTKKAVKFVKRLNPGDVAIMGNTRKNEGEEKNDPKLAKQFSKLGKYVAVGGFGKAHRAHASNFGILKHLTGYATRSQLKEMKILEPWAKKQDTYSIAVLGGVKKEKITLGLTWFAQKYDAIIPGGIVLSTILKVMGYDIGESVIKDKGKTFEEDVKKVLEKPNRAEIYIPNKVIIAKQTEEGFKDAYDIDISQGVPKDYMIVDYIMPNEAEESLDKLVKQSGRIILAGIPSVYTKGFKSSTDAVLKRLKMPNVESIVLGGSTSEEVDFKGPSSTGGGSALYFVANETTHVFEALKANKKK